MPALPCPASEVRGSKCLWSPLTFDTASKIDCLKCFSLCRDQEIKPGSQIASARKAGTRPWGWWGEQRRILCLSSSLSSTPWQICCHLVHCGWWLQQWRRSLGTKCVLNKHQLAPGSCHTCQPMAEFVPHWIARSKYQFMGTILVNVSGIYAATDNNFSCCKICIGSVRVFSVTQQNFFSHLSFRK